METPVQRKKLNLGIVAHADAGKTTLTEQILYLAGAVRAAGSVDDGTASTDTLAVERERGISVRTACASVFWKGVKLNLIAVSYTHLEADTGEDRRRLSSNSAKRGGQGENQPSSFQRAGGTGRCKRCLLYTSRCV